jgi:hypothetical protein
MKKEYKPSGQTNPIKQKEEVQKSNDRHIDQDFEGYPHSLSSENLINPKTREDKLTAEAKDGENISQRTEEVKKNSMSDQSEEIASDGSANAFESTEGMSDDSEGKHEKPRIDERSKVY